MIRAITIQTSCKINERGNINSEYNVGIEIESHLAEKRNVYTLCDKCKHVYSLVNIDYALIISKPLSVKCIILHLCI